MRKLTSSIWGAVKNLQTTAVESCRAASIRRGPVLWLILCGGFLIAAIIIGTVMMIGEFRESALRNSERELENTVRLLTHHFDQHFEDSDVIARNLISQMQFSEVASPELFKSRFSTPEAHLMLKSRVSELSYIGDVFVVAADGSVINSSGVWPPPEVNIADRAYFKAFEANPRLTVALAGPIKSRFTGNWTNLLVHRLSGSDGAFLGVMSRRIDPANLEKFFASVALGKGAAISMFDRDGTMLARHPHADSMIGRNFRTGPLLTKILAEGGQQTLRLQSPIDGQERLGSVGELSHFPIIIIATTTVAAALADWQAQTRFMVARRPLRHGHRRPAIPDHQADDPATPGSAAAAGAGKASARYCPEQHDSRPRAV
jgi:Histidine kinase sensor domain